VNIRGCGGRERGREKVVTLFKTAEKDSHDGACNE